MNIKKLTVFSIVVLISFFVIISCKKKNENDNSYNNIVNKGTFILGLDDSFPPMGYRDENGEIVGFDIDVAKEVCKNLNIELKIQPIDWSAKELELLSGNIDCIWNGFTVTEERQKNILFSRPYLKVNQVIIVKNGTNYTTLSDLYGKKIGLQAGSSGQQAYENSTLLNNTTPIEYKDFLTAIQDLYIGGIDAVVIDEIVLNSQLKNSSLINQIHKIDGISLSYEDFAIGFRKNDKALCGAIENELKVLKDSGKLREISQKWFDDDLIDF